MTMGTAGAADGPTKLYLATELVGEVVRIDRSCVFASTRDTVAMVSGTEEFDRFDYHLMRAVP